MHNMGFLNKYSPELNKIGISDGLGPGIAKEVSAYNYHRLIAAAIRGGGRLIVLV